MNADVVVIGGGPAGLATAGALARRGADVVLLERAPTSPRVGETVGAEVRPLFEELGAWDAIEDVLRTQIPFRGLRSVWGSAEITERASIFHPLGDGWHVDRTTLDTRLAAWAASQGVTICGVGASGIARDGDAFAVTTEGSGTVRAARVVDASGRGAPATSSIGGRRWLAADRQAGVAWWVDGEDAGYDLLLEATEDGWWYVAPRPGGGVVVVLVTDSDLVPAGGRGGLVARHAAALARTVHVKELVPASAPDDALKVVRADSGRMVPDRVPGLLAVGDASMATDPLGGNGIVRALGSALALAADLDAGRDAGHEAARAKTFDDYLELRARYYTTETRFPDAPFWARRRPIDWRRAELALGPEDVLAWVAEPGPHAEALLPPRAIAELRDALSAPAPAHVVLARLRDASGLGDRRLLVGLQELLGDGALRLA